MSSLNHPIPPNSTLVTTASSNQSGSNDFVKKLFLMLQEDSYKNVVKWTQNGDSFVVLNTSNFTKDILPRHFKHSNFASFVRQLNKYDFHKVKIPNDAKSTYPYGEDAWEFKHPNFKINDRESLENIKRKGPTAKKSTNGSKTSSAPAEEKEIKTESTNESNGSHSCNYNQINTAQNQLKDQINQLKDSNQMLNQEINILERKYKTLVEHIVSINSFNERYHRSISVLMNVLLQSGIKIPPLDFPPPANVGAFKLQDSPTFPNLSATSLPSISQHLQQSSPRLNQSPIVPQIVPPHINRSISIPHHTRNHGSVSYSITSPVSGLASISRHSSIHQPNPPSDQTPTSTPNINQELVQPSPKPVSPLTNSTASPNAAGTAPSAVNTSSATVNTTTATINTTNIPNPKFNVLLVEDDNVCIQLCRKFLVKYGCQVTVVTDGLNAISTVENTKYDLVLMDIVMPNLDGATATSVIRSFDTKTPIIAMTGNIEDNDLVTYLQNGMSDILAKPFTKDDLYSILSKHLLKEEPETKKQRID
ncbi:SKN7 [Candida pseudojiufengensis]|uniref:SKN7 n=1 Tax=Candida pseudojiufengensis TaxID=497109 RepID=UPI0022245A81|nr:SKN7 [Candida pseudojiufengensis]KAI5964053.1 SKN7 [Candida pseudojiufengensis]